MTTIKKHIFPFCLSHWVKSVYSIARKCYLWRHCGGLLVLPTLGACVTKMWPQLSRHTVRQELVEWRIKFLTFLTEKCANNSTSASGYKHRSLVYDQQIKGSSQRTQDSRTSCFYQPPSLVYRTVALGSIQTVTLSNITIIVALQQLELLYDCILQCIQYRHWLV